MWEGNYGTEPFDLRLTVLRLFRCMGWIVGITLLGTCLFGGGYYVKNVLLGEKPRYEQTITCKLEYTDPPVQSGDYYINDMTWNTYVDSEAFRGMLGDAEPFTALDVTFDMFLQCASPDAGDVLRAAVASDIHVPSFTVSCLLEEQTVMLSQAMQTVLTGPWVEYLPELATVQVINVSDVALVYPDVRPLRAVILSAILSCFFAVVFFLLREIGADSIWLPATLRRRYGVPVLGTLQSVELIQNAGYLFKGMSVIGVCSTEKEINLQQVTKALQEKWQNDPGETAAEDHGKEHAGKPDGGLTWKMSEAPLQKPEDAEILRQADGVLVVVPAGSHAGKPLEYLLEFLQTQNIEVTAALLWKADERLIKSYYFLPGGRK